MQLKLLAFGKKMPAWVNTAFQEFQKRLSPYCTLSLQELDTPKRTKNTSIEKLKQQEAELVKAHLPAKALIVALDEKGRQWSSVKLAAQLQRWQDESLDVCFLIGGPDGFDAGIIETADVHWSLGELVYPHALVRVIVAEQLYRGFCINHQHPYHRS